MTSPVPLVLPLALLPWSNAQPQVLSLLSSILCRPPFHQFPIFHHSLFSLSLLASPILPPTAVSLTLLCSSPFTSPQTSSSPGYPGPFFSPPTRLDPLSVRTEKSGKSKPCSLAFLKTKQKKVGNGGGLWEGGGRPWESRGQALGLHPPGLEVSVRSAFSGAPCFLQPQADQKGNLSGYFMGIFTCL